jgi:hypothetical protein
VINNETVFILSGILGIWTWIFKVFVIDSLQRSIDRLSETIKETTNEVNRVDATLIEHGTRIDAIDRRVETLENKK